MTKKKKVDKFGRTSISLGGIGNPARVVKEQYSRLHGKQEFSRLVRKLLVQFKKDKTFQQHLLVCELDSLAKELNEIIKRRRLVLDQLTELGVDVDEITVTLACREEVLSE